MNYFIKSLIQISIYLIFIYILFFTQKIYAVDKILFKLNNLIYTTIDLQNRKNYLEVISNQKYTNIEIINDLISINVFNEHSKNININIGETVIQNYIKNIPNVNSVNIDTIKYNLILDLQRKKIIEKLLQKEEKIIKENKLNLIDIYDINIEYFYIKNKNNIDISEIKKNINISKIEKTKKFLTSNNILYHYVKKEIKNKNNIDPDLKKNITSLKKNFVINKKNYFMIGLIKYKIKKNIKSEFLLIKFNNESLIKDKEEKCKILEKNFNIDVKKYEYIPTEKLNEFIIKNLILINEYIKIEENKFIILCDIKFNKKLLQEIIFYKTFEEKIKEIENNFIKEKKIEYNFIKYE